MSENEFMKKEWEPQEGMMPVVSIAQPYERALALGKVKIILKPWKTNYRGKIALHAGKAWYNGVRFDKGKAYEYEVRAIAKIIMDLDLPHYPRDYPMGAITMTATLTRCSTFSEEGWHRLRDQHGSQNGWDPQMVGWALKDIAILPEPIVDVRGYPGIFAVEKEKVEHHLLPHG